MTQLFFNNLLFFYCTTNGHWPSLGSVVTWLCEHPASQNRRCSGSRKPFALKQHFSFRAEVESRSTQVHKKSSHLSQGQWLLKYRVKLQISRYHPEVMRFYVRLTKTTHQHLKTYCLHFDSKIYTEILYMILKLFFFIKFWFCQLL